jgi:hypothetical protein
MMKRLLILLSFLHCAACGIIFDGLFPEGEEDDPVKADEIECGPEGMLVRSELGIPLDGAGTTADAHCDQWRLDFFDNKYEACCDGNCCSWGVGVPGSEGLAQEDMPCMWSGMCETDLTCFEESMTEGATCRKGTLGEWCDSKHLCEPALYCRRASQSTSAWTKEGTCMAHVAIEGHGCLPYAYANPCVAPLACSCPTLKDCRCWDGSYGDPCEAGSCEAGLFCTDQPAESDEFNAFDPVCLQGLAGDPCPLEEPCPGELLCLTVLGHNVCGILLEEGSPCTPESPGEICAPGFECNAGFDPPVCSGAGGGGTPCTGDLHCLQPLFCVSELQECWGGKPGDPCFDNYDCAAPGVCLDSGDHGVCTVTHSRGEHCSPDAPFIHCLPGLVCVSSKGGHICGDPGIDGTPCGEDGDCAPGYWCLHPLYECSNGNDGDPCISSDDCGDDYQCITPVQACHDGSYADPCLATSQCQAALVCHAQHHLCLDGHLGAPCLVAEDCPQPLLCVGMAEGDGACFQFAEEGASCGASAPPFTACAAGLICQTAEEEHKCVPIP